MYAALAGFAVLAGCAALRTPAPDLAVEGARTTEVELRDVPFFPQEVHQCGPAALATVLVASGVQVQPEELVPLVYLPGRRGSLQAELVATARARGRLPYALDSTLSAIAAELEAGRPVLVLQNLGLDWWPRWHYAVVVGLTPRRVILRSGRTARLEMPATRFLRTWRAADSWAVVTLPPGELPAIPDADRWLRANAASEEVGQTSLAHENYRVAARRWPEHPLVWVALGNAEYRAGRRPEAERAYRRAVALDPGDAVALNNLAHVLIERGCTDDASALLERARAVAAPPFRAAIDSTARALDRALTGKSHAAGTSAQECPPL